MEFNTLARNPHDGSFVALRILEKKKKGWAVLHEEEMPELLWQMAEEEIKRLRGEVESSCGYFR